MKTTIFYVALFIGCILTFNAGAYDHLYYENAINYVERNRADLDPKTVKHCNSITGIGRTAIEMRDEGISEADTIADLDNSMKEMKKKTGKNMPVNRYLEMARMIRTVYRYPKMDVDQYNQQFFAECIMLGGYS